MPKHQNNRPNKHASNSPKSPRHDTRNKRNERDAGSRRGNTSRDAVDHRVRGAGRSERRTRPSRMPLDEAPARYPGRGKGHTLDQSFKCGHCNRFIGPLPSGGHHRNHCPICLYSRHVDDRHSGDRASACGSLMQPIGAFQRPNGEHVIVHRCLGCGFERFNRIAADDDFDLVLSLPILPPRSARPTDTPDAGATD